MIFRKSRTQEILNILAYWQSFGELKVDSFDEAVTVYEINKQYAQENRKRSLKLFTVIVSIFLFLLSFIVSSDFKSIALFCLFGLLIFGVSSVVFCILEAIFKRRIFWIITFLSLSFLSVVVQSFIFWITFGELKGAFFLAGLILNVVCLFWLVIPVIKRFFAVIDKGGA